MLTDPKFLWGVAAGVGGTYLWHRYQSKKGKG